jgi:purine-binding chemotaxis protein CheW
MSPPAVNESIMRSFCTFRAEGRLYGIDVTHLREVSTQVIVTPVPQAPAAIRGLTNLRSRIYLVIDLRPLLGLAPVETTARSRLLIFKNEFAEDLGLLVDRGGDAVQVNQNDIETSSPASSFGETSGEPVRSLAAGVCKLEAELLVMLDPQAIVSEAARQIR